MMCDAQRRPTPVTFCRKPPSRSGTRTQWRLVHPRVHGADVTPEVARRLGHLLLRRSSRRPPSTSHRTSSRPIVHYHILTRRHHALDITEPSSSSSTTPLSHSRTWRCSSSATCSSFSSRGEMRVNRLQNDRNP